MSLERARFLKYFIIAISVVRIIGLFQLLTWRTVRWEREAKLADSVFFFSFLIVQLIKLYHAMIACLNIVITDQIPPKFL